MITACDVLGRPASDVHLLQHARRTSWRRSGVVASLVRGCGQRLVGQSEQTRQTYQALLTRIAEPDRGGLDESHHRWTNFGVMAALGMHEDNGPQGRSQLGAHPLEEP